MALRHIAFIMDGNGRWAKSQNLSIGEGHKQGLIALESILNHCLDLGMKTITLYAFSSENWKRTQDEKDVLFGLLDYYFREKLDKIIERKARVKIIGEVSHFSPEIQQVLRDSEERSKNNNDCLLQMALSYGGRNEIVRATQKIAEKVRLGEMGSNEIDENIFARHLDTEGDDPDLLIRTSGELRVSNFLLYQLAYTEFYFTDTYWPAFTPAELDEAIREYNQRDRRFGERKQ